MEQREPTLKVRVLPLSIVTAFWKLGMVEELFASKICILLLPVTWMGEVAAPKVPCHAP